jgi:hypothetical protein
VGTRGYAGSGALPQTSVVQTRDHRVCGPSGGKQPPDVVATARCGGSWASALAARAALHPRLALRDARNPAKAFGYFTLVAALGVLASRIALTGAGTWALTLAAAAIAVWVFWCTRCRPA